MTPGQLLLHTPTRTCACVPVHGAADGLFTVAKGAVELRLELGNSLCGCFVGVRVWACEGWRVEVVGWRGDLSRPRCCMVTTVHACN